MPHPEGISFRNGNGTASLEGYTDCYENGKMKFVVANDVIKPLKSAPFDENGIQAFWTDRRIPNSLFDRDLHGQVYYPSTAVYKALEKAWFETPF